MQIIALPSTVKRLTKIHRKSLRWHWVHAILESSSRRMTECAVTVYATSPESVDLKSAVGAPCDGDNDRRVFDDQGLYWTQQQRAQQPLLMEEMDSKYVYCRAVSD